MATLSNKKGVNSQDTIPPFVELLEIFDRRSPIFGKILTEVEKRKKKNRAFVIGINGIDASGKTKFTEAFNKFLLSKKYRTEVINLDDFHNPKKIRYSGLDQSENYYNRSFAIQTIIDKLLIPIHRQETVKVKIKILNLQTDKYEIIKNYNINQDTFVLFEGVFLYREELSPFIDYKIFLEIPFGESKKRAMARDIPLYGKEILKKYDEKYLPAQKKYLRKFPPTKIANMIIENSNWEYPKIQCKRK